MEVVQSNTLGAMSVIFLRKCNYIMVNTYK